MQVKKKTELQTLVCNKSQRSFGSVNVDPNLQDNLLRKKNYIALLDKRRKFLANKFKIKNNF